MPYDPDWEFREDRVRLGGVIGSGAFGQVVKAEAIGILALNAREKTGEAYKRRCKIRRSIKARKMEHNPEHWRFAVTTVAVKMLKGKNGTCSAFLVLVLSIGDMPYLLKPFHFLRRICSRLVCQVLCIAERYKSLSTTM